MILKLRRMLRNPAPVHRWFTPLFVGFQPSQVQDFALPSTVFFFGGHSKTRGSLWFFIFDEYHPFLSGHHGWEVRPGGNGLFPDCKPKDYSSQMRLWHWVYHISVVGCIDISIYIYIYTAYYPIISPINIYIYKHYICTYPPVFEHGWLGNLRTNELFLAGKVIDGICSRSDSKRDAARQTTPMFIFYH